MSRWMTAVLAAVVLGGCGSEPQLSAGAAEDLRAGVDAVRLAAGAGDREGALRALEELRSRVDREADAGRLSEADAAVLRRGIARARRRAEREIAAPQPAPEPTAEPTPEPTAEPAPAPPEGEKPGKGKGPKPGKGRGNGRGFGDDDSDDDEGGD